MDKISSRRDLLKIGVGAGAIGAGSLLLGGCEQTSIDEDTVPTNSNFVIPRPAATTIPVVGSMGSFPVRRVYCLGRNYSAHAREMGDDPNESPPFYFQKPTDAVVSPPRDFVFPSHGTRLGYEAEMLVALKSGGRNIPTEDAAQHIYGYGIGLDMTLRGLQDDSKERRRPWEQGKSFDYSAPCSHLHRIEETGELTTGRIWLSVNDAMRQEADMSLMRWNVNEAIAFLSARYELMAGDIILTGTPEGVGLVERGDVIKAGVDGLDTLEVKIV